MVTGLMNFRMSRKQFALSAAWLVLLWTGLRSRVEAAPANEALTIGYSSFSGLDVPLWIAVEDRLGRKYGVDLKAVYAGRARPQQLLMSGETPLVVATGTGALTSEEHPDVYYCVIEVDGIAYRLEEMSEGRIEVQTAAIAVFPGDNSDTLVIGYDKSL